MKLQPPFFHLSLNERLLRICGRNIPAGNAQRNTIFGPHRNVATDVKIFSNGFDIPAHDYFGQRNAHGVFGQTRTHTATVPAAKGQKLIDAVMALQKTLRTKNVWLWVEFWVVVNADNRDSQ